jgi:hypothetical protein
MTNISERYKQKNFEAECFCQYQQQQLEKLTSKSLENIHVIQQNFDFMIPGFMFFSRIWYKQLTC